jgi:carboxypeptidase Q
MTEQNIAEAETTPVPAARGGRGAAADEAAGGGRGGRGNAQAIFRQKLEQFYVDEGVVATFDRGSDSDMAAGGSDMSWQQQHPDGGTIFPTGSGARDANAGRAVPEVTLAVEHYNRMVRVLDKGLPVTVELNVETKFYDETTPNGFNTVAEIPGGDLASEVVMLGAHFDSHPYATGATDNATGSAAMMEAMRILRAVGAKPRRTIRVALWGGEEQGLLGSRAYVREHFADVETMALKPEHAKLAAYFNSDNGTGRVRGIWLQGNMAARPIFEAWMAPLKDLGVTIVGPRSVSQTDHVSFDSVGLPGFQFLVDRLEYNARTHHSNMDTFDRVQRDDMVQQATVVAAFAYDAAMRDEKLPRKALPAPQRGRGTSSQP